MLHFSEKGNLFVRWSDGKLILKILGFSDLVIEIEKLTSDIMENE